MTPPFSPPADAAEQRDWLRLIRSENVGPATFAVLMRRYQSAANALEALPELAARGGARALRIADAAAVDAELETGDRLGAELIALGSADYPPLLAKTHSPPPILWLLGRRDLLTRDMIGIVGARNASALGRRLAQRFAKELGAAGYVVISGMARGIDQAAHDGAFATGTIAVLGGAVDHIYPPGAEDTHARLRAEGAILSESPFGHVVKARDFPRRNRIIAGAALGVLAAEAAERSGSLITARYALEEGREVMAVPGSPLDPRAGGCNMLIRQGAALARHGADVVEALTAAPFALREPPDPPYTPPPDVSEIDDAGRARVIELLGPAPTEIDDIVRRSGLTHGQTALALLELDLAGRLSREPGGRVVLLPD